MHNHLYALRTERYRLSRYVLLSGIIVSQTKRFAGFIWEVDGPRRCLEAREEREKEKKKKVTEIHINSGSLIVKEQQKNVQLPHTGWEKLWEYSQELTHHNAPIYDAWARLSGGTDACRCRTRIFSRPCASAYASSAPTISWTLPDRDRTRTASPLCGRSCESGDCWTLENLCRKSYTCGASR